MEFNIKIQKTDVKNYDVNVSINYEELVEYVNNSNFSYKQYLDEYFFDEDTGETNPSKSDVTEEEYYKGYIEDYIESLDADLLFTDNCNNHQEYQLESEECVVIESEEITNG